MITNQDHAQNVGTEERRYLCNETDSKWIHIVCEEKQWKTHQYFDYLANMDSRVLGYYLACKVDLTNFNPKADRFANRETAKQKISSFHVTDLPMAFWSQFIKNEIHNYIKPKDDRRALMLQLHQLRPISSL